MARPKAALVVTKADRQVLDSMAHRARTAPQLARRARIVLACATGLDNTTVAKKLRISKPTVGRWRQRFIDKGGDGLLDEPRPGAPRTINDTQVEAVVTRTLETTPRGATHWSTRTLAKATGVSPMSVHRIWQAFGLQPHRMKTFKLSPDPLLIDKVRDIVELYLNPPQALDGSPDSSRCLGRDDQMSGPSGGASDASGRRAKVEKPPVARGRLQPPPRSRPGHRARRPARRALVVLEGGVPRNPVKPSRRQTLACAGGRRRRSARFGGGSPDSAGGSRVLSRACGDGYVV